MNKFFMATLLGAVSIMLLAGLGQGGSAPAVQATAAPLPATSADAARAELPRECDNSANVTTDCIY